MKRRIGIVTYDFHPHRGGQGRFTYELWRRLRSMPGLDVKVFSPADNNLRGHVRTGAILSRHGRQFGFSLAVSRALARIQREHEIDVFHFNGGPGGVLLVRRPEAPFLYTAHHTYAQQSRLVPGEGWKRWLTGLESSGYVRSDRVCADTPSTAEAVVSELGVPADRVQVIPLGVDATRFWPMGLPRIADSVLFVGRMDTRKGVWFLLSAWLEVLRERPSACLYFIGDGADRPRAERWVRDHGIDDSVRFLGRVSEDELVEWYNRTWCVAVPSRFEGFGLSAAEAVCCGTPVVATDSDGLRHVVSNGRGRLVPFGDTSALAGTLCAVLDDNPGLDHERVADAHREFDWMGIAERYAEVYRSVEAPA